MKLSRSLSFALALAAVGAPTWAAEKDQHQGHHLVGAASAPASKAVSGQTTPDMARMDTRMKAMRDMHEKMMAAKTSEERDALMADHMKAMQEGMTMMNGMPARGMSGTKGGMAAQHQMMEKRMEMMQTMMQMMMDRLPAAPAK